MLGLENLLIPG